MANRVKYPMTPGQVTGNRVKMQMPPNPEEINPPAGPAMQVPVADQKIPDRPPSQRQAIPQRGGGAAYTDRPELAGTEAAPGVPWQVVTGAGEAGQMQIPGRDFSGPVPLRPEYKGELDGMAQGPIKAGEDYDVVGALEEISRLEEMIKPPGKKPSEGEKIITYSAEDREDFRNQVINQYLDGMDPYQINPYEALTQVEEQLMPEVFNEFFGGQRLYDDWKAGLLTPEEEAAWMQRYKQVRANAFNIAKQQREQGMEILNDMLERWDAQAKDYRARLDKIRKEHAKSLEKAGEREDKRTETARKERKERFDQRKDIIKAESEIRDKLQEAKTDEGKQYRKTGKIPNHMLRRLNNLRRDAGLPALVERTGEDKKIFYEEEQGGGQQRGRPAGPAGPSDMNYLTNLTPDQEAELKRVFPNAVQDPQGRWMAPNAEGKMVYIINDEEPAAQRKRPSGAGGGF